MADVCHLCSNPAVPRSPLPAPRALRRPFGCSGVLERGPSCFQEAHTDTPASPGLGHYVVPPPKPCGAPKPHAALTPVRIDVADEQRKARARAAFAPPRSYSLRAKLHPHRSCWRARTARAPSRSHSRFRTMGSHRHRWLVANATDREPSATRRRRRPACAQGRCLRRRSYCRSCQAGYGCSGAAGAPPPMPLTMLATITRRPRRRSQAA